MNESEKRWSDRARQHNQQASPPKNEQRFTISIHSYSRNFLAIYANFDFDGCLCVFVHLFPLVHTDTQFRVFVCVCFCMLSGATAESE